MSKAKCGRRRQRGIVLTTDFDAFAIELSFTPTLVECHLHPSKIKIEVSTQKNTYTQN